MELKDLSNNWRKLQEIVKKDDASRPPKRKVSESLLQPQRNRMKHPIFKDIVAMPDQTINTSKEKSMALSWSKAKKNSLSASLALWAEDNDISTKDLATAYGTSMESISTPHVSHTEDKINEGLSPTAAAGRYVAIDCEMVGVGPTPDSYSALARVSLVDYHGHQLYDSFVSPKEAITDYRTHVSGITPELLQKARSLEAVQADVARLLDGRILIGHAIKNDMSALLLGHSKRDIRDTSRHQAYKALARGRTPGLKKLAREVLGLNIQGGEHSSIEDARATMLLFRRDKEGFESEHLKKWGPNYRKSNRTGHETFDRAGEKKKKSKKKKKPKR